MDGRRRQGDYHLQAEYVGPQACLEMMRLEEDRDPFDWVCTMFEELAGLSRVQKEAKAQVSNWCEGAAWAR